MTFSIIFVERKCWVLTLKVGYTFLQETLYISGVTWVAVINISNAFDKMCFVLVLCELFAPIFIEKRAESRTIDLSTKEFPENVFYRTCISMNSHKMDQQSSFYTSMNILMVIPSFIIYHCMAAVNFWSAMRPSFLGEVGVERGL